MPLHYAAWRQSLDAVGIKFSEERFYAMAGMPTEKIVATLAAENQIELDPQGVADEKERLFLANLGQLRAQDWVCEIVRRQYGKTPMAVASGSQRDSVLAQLEAIGLADVFDAIVTAEDTVRHKPQPDVFLKAAELIGVAAAKCVVYEDADLGIQAAQAAGMDYVDVRIGPQAVIENATDSR